MYTPIAGIFAFSTTYLLLAPLLPHDPKACSIKTSRDINAVVIRTLVLLFISGPILWYIVPDLSAWFPNDYVSRFLLCVLIADFVFYMNHWLFHKYFYNLHKMHHEFTVVKPIAALYASPYELVFCDMLSVGLAPSLLNMGLYELQVWMIFMAVHSLMLHSNTQHGYEHSNHHSKILYNYGLFGIVDKILGTHI
jgi:sterol desaturase/sphingolipid hydroxylase (fatty acid hydroxylase superfamily)